jgi:hypothetical protein
MEFTIRKVKPVKRSTLHKKVERYRDGFVTVFLENEGALVLDEDGQPLRNGKGRQSVTVNWFAAEMGIPVRTFRNWVKGVKQPAPRISANHAEMEEDESGDEGESLVCSCIPDPGCPIHGEGVKRHGSPLEDRHA